MRVRIVEIVKAHPQELGEPYANWSLSRLRAYLLRTRVVQGYADAAGEPDGSLCNGAGS